MKGAQLYESLINWPDREMLIVLLERGPGADRARGGLAGSGQVPIVRADHRRCGRRHDHAGSVHCPRTNRDGKGRAIHQCDQVSRFGLDAVPDSNRSPEPACRRGRGDGLGTRNHQAPAQVDGSLPYQRRTETARSRTARCGTRRVQQGDRDFTLPGRGLFSARLRSEAVAKGDLALADFDRALRCDPQLAHAYLHRGRLRTEKGEFDAALADFDQVMSMRPNDAECYLNRGICLAKKGMLSDATDDFRRVLKLTNHSDYADPARFYLDHSAAIHPSPGPRHRPCPAPMEAVTPLAPVPASRRTRITCFDTSRIEARRLTAAPGVRRCAFRSPRAGPKSMLVASDRPGETRSGDQPILAKARSSALARWPVRRCLQTRSVCVILRSQRTHGAPRLIVKETVDEPGR